MDISEISDGRFLHESMEWLRGHTMDSGALIQSIIIAASLLTGFILYRAVKVPLVQAIDRLELPLYLRKILLNLKRLLIYIIALCVMFMLTQVVHSLYPAVSFALCEAAMKILMTWIAIRMVLQFIENAALRNIFALLILAIATLSIFGILDETGTTLDAVGFNIGQFRFSALVIIKAMLSLFILLYMALFMSGFLERRIMRTRSLSQSSKVLIIKILRIALVVFAILIGVASSGVDLSIFAVFSGAVGLGVGFGLQKVASNLFSGILLLTDKSINPGDIIELENGTFGLVNRMAARYTEIYTRDNKSYLIPNEDFITQRIVNWSHGNKFIRLEVRFAVHDKVSPVKVIEIATEAALKAERVVSDREAVCWVTGLGEDTVDFSLRFWIQDAENGVTNVKGQVMFAIWDAFQAHKIKFANLYQPLSVATTA
ncbi:MAG: mechanosensitive ion channel family protein [Alphaproteobacteria bacterium]